MKSPAPSISYHAPTTTKETYLVPGTQPLHHYHPPHHHGDGAGGVGDGVGEGGGECHGGGWRGPAKGQGLGPTHQSHPATPPHPYHSHPHAIILAYSAIPYRAV